MIKANSEGYTVFRAVGENINIHDLTIDGNQSFLRGLTVMNGSKNLTLNNVVLEHFGQPSTGSQTNSTPIAIRIEGGVENVIMNHLVIRDVYAKNVSSEVGWDHKVARGILISPAVDTQPGSNNITIQHSSITEIGPKDDGDGIVVQGFTNDVGLKIYNNVFDKNHKRAIKIQSPGAEIKNNQIINSFQSNNFYETYKETYEYDMWSAISVYANNVKIEGNTISGTGSFSAAVDIAGGNNVEVIGNWVANGENSVYTKSDTIRINKGYDGTSSFKNISIINNTLNNGRYGIFKVVTVDGLTTSGNSYTNLVYPTNIQ